MLKEEKKGIISNEISSKRMNVFCKKFPELYSEVNAAFPQLTDYPFAHKIHWYINDIDNFSYCVVCGKINRRKIHNINKGYLNDCCTASCACKHPNTIKRHKKTYMERYGVESPLQSKEIRQRWKQTCREKYNAESPFNSKEIQDKIKQTCISKYGKNTPNAQKWKQEHTKRNVLQKYGVENVSMLQPVKDKKKQTCTFNYGVESPFKSETVRNRAKQTCMDRYGVENPLQSEVFKEKSKQTNLTKYGTPYASQSTNFKERVHNTKKINNTFNISKPEQDAYQSLILKYPIVLKQHKDEKYPFNCDFYIPSIDTYIELNYTWMHGGEPYTGTITQQDKVGIWENRSRELNHTGKLKKSYSQAINTWTVSDLKKRVHALSNNLKWLCFYNKSEFLSWLNE